MLRSNKHGALLASGATSRPARTATKESAPWAPKPVFCLLAFHVHTKQQPVFCSADSDLCNTSCEHETVTIQVEHIYVFFLDPKSKLPRMKIIIEVQSIFPLYCAPVFWPFKSVLCTEVVYEHNIRVAETNSWTVARFNLTIFSKNQRAKFRPKLLTCPDSDDVCHSTTSKFLNPDSVFFRKIFSKLSVIMNIVIFRSAWVCSTYYWDYSCRDHESDLNLGYLWMMSAQQSLWRCVHQDAM